MNNRRKREKVRKRPIFTQAQLENLHAYFDTLRRIHARLAAEGKDGRALSADIDNN